MDPAPLRGASDFGGLPRLRLKGVLSNSKTPVQSVIPTSARSARGGICKKTT
jgi:hypothetical protein